MSIVERTIHVVTIMAVAASAASAQVRVAQPNIDELTRRIEDLEAKVKMLTEDLSRRQPPPVDIQTAAKVSVAAPANAEPAPNEAKQQSKSRDIGVDLGGVKLTPYGIIYFNMFANTRGVNNTDVPIFAAASGNGGTSASLRQTRLGFRLEGAKVGKNRLGAIVEADFFGGSPGVGIGENFGLVRLRLANIRLDWEKTGLTIGQDWVPFAPLNPVSLAAAAIPQMASAGNNWARIPQIKVERRYSNGIALQAAVLAPQTGDSSATGSFFLQPNSGSTSGVPFFQGRIGFAGKNWFASNKPGAIGLSGHYGRIATITGPASTRFTDASWGVAGDWNLPLSDVVAITGEAFVGQGLGGFQGGVFQGINPDFASIQGNAATADGIRAIGALGGWVQLAVTPRIKGNKLGLYGTIGIDDPDDSDLTSVTSRDWRTRNLAFAAEIIYKFSPQFHIGIEVRRFDTRYRLSRRRTAEHINLAFAYSF